MKSFRITDNKGFQISFANGWTVSVQFGPGNYGDHYDKSAYCKDTCTESDEAEIGVFHKGPDEKGNTVWWETEQSAALDFCTGVTGYKSAEQVAEVIAIVSNLS